MSFRHQPEAARNLGRGSSEYAWTHHTRPLAEFILSTVEGLGLTCHGDF
jgi:hypothetical protein